MELINRAELNFILRESLLGEESHEDAKLHAGVGIYARIFRVWILLKIDRRYNKTDIFNQIRAIKNVIVVTPREDKRLNRMDDSNYEYSLLRISYYSSDGNPNTQIEYIKQVCTDGEAGATIRGVVGFSYRRDQIQIA